MAGLAAPAGGVGHTRVVGMDLMHCSVVYPQTERKLHPVPENMQSAARGNSWLYKHLYLLD